MVLKVMDKKDPTRADPFDSAVTTLGVPESAQDEEPTVEPETEADPETAAEGQPLDADDQARQAAAERADRLRDEQAEQAKQKADQDQEFVAQNIDLLRAIEKDPALKAHILGYFRQGQEPERGEEAPRAEISKTDDPYAGIDPEDRKYVDLMTAKVMKDILAAIGKELAPIKDFTSRMAHDQERGRGQRELEDLERQFPDWKDIVEPKALAEAKAMRPELPVASIFRILAFDRTYADRTKSRQAISERLTRTPPPESITRPRQTIRTRPGPRASQDPMGDAFDDALAKFPLLRAEGGGR